MKRPDSFLANTTAPAGRAFGQAINDPGGSTGSGVDQEIYNDPAYANIAMAESWKEGGISDSNETTTNADMRDAIEEMASKKVSGIPEWLVGNNYNAPGTVTDTVMWKGFQFVNISNVGNLGNDPLLNPDLWYKIPTPERLMDFYYSGEPISGGLSPMNDRASGKYLQNSLMGKFRLGGNGEAFYNFFRVALDGTVVTGDTTLNDIIFKVGTADEYFNIDLIAPDVLGTRTLIDMSSRHIAPQSSGGDNDTLGEVLEDRFQGHLHELSVRPTDGISGTTEGGATDGTITTNLTGVPYTDGTNGTPRTGSTTRPKEFTVGASYIIIMQAA